MIGLCGCMSNDETNRAEEMQRLALDYLKNLYDHEFKLTSFSSGESAYNYCSVFFSSKKYEDSCIEVRVYELNDGVFTFKDNYYHCFMMNDAIDYLRVLTSEQTVSTKVRFLNAVWSDELNGAKTFAEWVDCGNCNLDVFYITNAPLSLDAKNRIVVSISECKIFGSVYFLTTNDELLLDSKTIDEILNNQKEYIISKDSYYINLNFEIESN